MAESSPQLEWFLEWMRHTVSLSMHYAPDGCPEKFQAGEDNEDRNRIMLMLMCERLVKGAGGNKRVFGPDDFKMLYESTMRNCVDRLNWEPEGDPDGDDDLGDGDEPDGGDSDMGHGAVVG